MKQAITPTYTFTPASRTVDLSSVSGFSLKNLYAIINTTRNTVIYAQGSLTYGLASIAGSVLTLNFDTTTHNAADVLTIIYDQAANTVTNFPTPIFFSSTAALGSSASIVSTSFDTNTNGCWISYSAFSVTALTVTFEVSADNVNFVTTDTYKVSAGGSNYSYHKPSARYCRVRYTNSATANTGGTANLALFASQSVIANETDVNIVDSFGNVIDAVNSAGLYNMAVAIGATNYISSTVNSTTAQLAAGATFNGTIENSFNQPSYTLLVTTDQPGTLIVRQYIDLAGTSQVSPVTYPVPAGTGYKVSNAMNGNYISISFTNNGASATTTLNINTAYGTIPSATDLNNAPSAINEVSGQVISLGQKTQALSFPVVQPSIPTYSASFSGALTATTATDIFTITGSATKTIKILDIFISGIQSTASAAIVNLIKRSTANTAGTSTIPSTIPYDSADASATAVVRAYTTNPTLGTQVGTTPFKTIRKEIPTAGFANSDYAPTVFDFSKAPTRPVILRGISEVFAINLASQSIAGNSFNISITWTEE